METFKRIYKKIHEQNLPLETFISVVDQVDAKKKENYKKSIDQYVKFFKTKDVEWFDIGSSHWDLTEPYWYVHNPNLAYILTVNLTF